MTKMVLLALPMVMAVPAKADQPLEALPAPADAAAAEAAQAPSQPSALPEPVRQMLRTALDSGNDADAETVAKLVRKLYPGAKDEVAAMIESQRKQTKARHVEAVKQAGITDLWSGKGEFGGFRSTGSSDELGLSASLTLKREGLLWTHSVYGSLDLRRANGITSREQFIGSYQPRYQFNQKGFGYALAQYERDPSTGFASRYSTSAGIGYKLLDGPAVSLSVDAGPSVRHVDYVDDTRETKVGLRSSLDFGWKLTPTVSLHQVGTSYLEDKVQTLSTQTSLDTRIMQRLTARFSYAFDYETQTRLTTQTLDTLSKLTLIYGF